MTAAITPEGQSAVAAIARRHGLSDQAVQAMLYALHVGGGTMAQFSIPELGGSGQWMRGGMTMVGDMFDNALKARVDALCNELVQLMSTTTVFRPTAATATAGSFGFPSSNWWPPDLGTPSSVGGQNDARYAVFPTTHRLAIHVSGVTRIFDTGEHQIGGVQQQQGGGLGTVTFTSQLGTFDVASLREVGGQQPTPTPAATTTPRAEPSVPAPASAPSSDTEAIINAIESLAGLRERGILTDEEFAAKKAELLGRL